LHPFSGDNVHGDQTKKGGNVCYSGRMSAEGVLLAFSEWKIAREQAIDALRRIRDSELELVPAGLVEQRFSHFFSAIEKREIAKKETEDLLDSLKLASAGDVLASFSNGAITKETAHSFLHIMRQREVDAAGNREPGIHTFQREGRRFIAGRNLDPKYSQAHAELARLAYEKQKVGAAFPRSANHSTAIIVRPPQTIVRRGQF
jgi:hypothetical protein